MAPVSSLFLMFLISKLSTACVKRGFLGQAGFNLEKSNRISEDEGIGYRG